MKRFPRDLPLINQVGVVIALFITALSTLWYTSAAVVEREERRARANERLKMASDELEARGKEALASIRAELAWQRSPVGKCPRSGRGRLERSDDSAQAPGRRKLNQPGNPTH